MVDAELLLVHEVSTEIGSDGPNTNPDGSLLRQVSLRVMVWRLEFGSRAMPICYTHIEKGRAGQLRPLLSAAIILDPAIEATHAQNAARGAAGFFTG